MLRQLLQILALILFSIAVVMLMPYVQQGIQALLTAHGWISSQLTQVFSGGSTGDLIRQLVAMLAMPIAIGLVPVIIYCLVKRAWFPYFMQVVWVVWLVEVTALVIQFKAVA